MKPKGINAVAWLARQSFNGGTRESDPQTELHLAEVQALRRRVKELETANALLQIENAALHNEQIQVQKALKDALEAL